MNIDWSIAPDWAIGHALYAFGGEISEVWVGEEKYQRLDQPKSFPYGGGVGETRHNPCRYQFRYETLRPAPWAGEGLPPVGTVCEMRAHKLNNWHKAEIKFSQRNVVVWDWVGEPAINGLCTAYAHDVEIRPIPTPEQIAAEQYERDAEELAKILAIHEPIEVLALAKLVLDCGYRKQVAE